MAQDRQVAVPELALLDVIDLALRALEQLDALQPNDALNDALRGAIMDLNIRGRVLVD
jgi:hypothetical protein